MLQGLVLQGLVLPYAEAALSSFAGSNKKDINFEAFANTDLHKRVSEHPFVKKGNKKTNLRDLPHTHLCHF